MGTATRQTMVGKLFRSGVYAGIGAAITAAEKMATASDWAARRRRFAPARVRADSGTVEAAAEPGGADAGAAFDPVLVAVGAAFVAGVVLARVIAWKGSRGD